MLKRDPQRPLRYSFLAVVPVFGEHAADDCGIFRILPLPAVSGTRQVFLSRISGRTKAHFVFPSGVVDLDV